MRIIDADALKALYEKALQLDPHEYIPPSGVIADIEAAPTIEAEPVVHGEWIRLNEHSLRPVCSECGYYGSVIDMPVNPFNFCPNCGADMRERKENGI